MPVCGASKHWKGIESRLHRFSGVEFRIGKRKIGHIQGGSLVDIQKVIDLLKRSYEIALKQKGKA